MALGKREKILAWAVGGACGLFLLDSLIFSPYFAHTKALADARTKDQVEAQNIKEERHKESNLKAKIQAIPLDPKEAERKVLGAIKDWASETGVTMSSVKPEYVDDKKQMRQILVVASGSGSNDAMMAFLLKMQNAQFPLRIAKLQLGTRNNEPEPLTVQLRVSTLYRTVEPPKKDAKPKENAKKVADGH